MAYITNEQYRSNPRFNRSQVNQALPSFFQEEYPKLVSFLEKYYEYTGEDGSVSINEQIHDLFGLRDISSTDLTHLDYLIGEISDGLETSSFYQNPRLMARLLTEMYRAKGTQISIEQFFKAFYAEDVQVSYPKKNIFILNDRPGGSLIGPQSLHYIQDDKKYQIFSVLLKTGMSLSDYETLYTKLIHPAGFYLAAETETQSSAELGLMAGETTDPLEVPNYALLLQTTQLGTHIQPTYSLLVMEENDPMDARTPNERATGTGIIVSSLETLDRYENVSLQQLADDFDTIADWTGVRPPTLDDEGLDLSQDYETLDASDHT